MAELSRDRVRAAKLRARKTLTPEQRHWLDEYEARTAMAKARKQRALPSGGGVKYTVVSSKKGADFKVDARELERPVAGQLPPREQLALSGDAFETPAGVPVHETEHLTDVIAPEQFTWEPTVPPPPTDADAPPPPPGVDAPPVGAPIVEEAQATQEQQGPPPKSFAMVFAGVVTFITNMGLRSAIELAGDLPIPDALREAADEAQGALLTEVGMAAFRLGNKYGLGDVKGQDEAVVALALAGSVTCIVQAHKKKLRDVSESSTETEAAPAPAARDSVRKPDNITDAEVVAPTSAKESGIPPHLASLLEG